MIKQTRNNHLLPQLKIIISQLQTAAHRYADLPMLSRTHGQPATPTTLGKEFANFAARLKTQYEQLKFIKIQGKFNGATGNYSAAAFAYPDMNWEKINKHFVEKLGLAWNAYTTQIEPHDYIAELSHCLIRINNIFTDFARNMWGYISLGYFKQTVHVNQIGSSTMPHKVNPIDFENAEGNFGVANALFEFFANKLPLSRFQRDLSDSTVMRNLGVAFAHTLIADQSLLKGLKTLQPNKKYLQDELENHWELLAEALQTLMRRHGIKNAYEKLKKLTHGKSITKTALHQWVDSLKLPLEEKQRFKQLTPAQYIGQAKTLAKKI